MNPTATDSEATNQTGSSAQNNLNLAGRPCPPLANAYGPSGVQSLPEASASLDVNKPMRERATARMYRED